MKPNHHPAPWLAGILLVFCVLEGSAQTTDQTIVLNPGWNAIHILVEPGDNSIASVFAGIPVESAWTHIDEVNAVEFISSPDELPFNDPGWRRYFPAASPNAFLTTLHTVNANRAYLVKLGGSAAVNLNLTGRPSYRRKAWVPDSFNLRGFNVEPLNQPAFGDFFAPATAHAGQAMYRLLTDGSWQAVDPSELMNAGEAYWVYSQGASDYLAPMSLRLETGDGLDFGISLDTSTITFVNQTLNESTTSVTELSGLSTNPLSRRVLSEVNASLEDLPQEDLQILPALGSRTDELTIRREDMVGETYSTVLSISDSTGCRHLVPVRASKTLPPGPAPLSATMSSSSNFAKQSLFAPASPVDSPINHIGLWVGTVNIDAVSEPHSGTVTLVPDPDPGNPLNNMVAVRTGALTENTPTKSSFPLRLILHVDNDGKASLLKEVIQMFQPGTTKVVDGLTVEDIPGKQVLLTDDTRIPEFQGAAIRDGQLVGRRISSIAFDFAENQLPMMGNFALAGTTSVNITLGPDFPTHPFRHRKHPDHDNLDSSYKDTLARPEVPTITRAISLEFDSAPPADLDSNGFGYSLLTGTFRETLTGLHSQPLKVSGTFQLTRVSDIGALNPPSTPTN